MDTVLDMGRIKEDVCALGREYGAERIYLFGSYAKGTATSDSDVDLRIDKGLIRGLIQLAGLQMELEKLLRTKVDLLTSDSLDEEFLARISSEEILLYEHD